jgi:hypothetical protein
VKVPHFGRFLRIALVPVVLCVLAGTVAADTIKLKNGSVIKGRVVSFSQGEFTIILDLGSSSRKSTSRMIIAAEDIESIEFDGVDSGAAPPRSTSSLEPAASDRSEEPSESKPKETKEAKSAAAAPPVTTPDPDTSPPAAATESATATGVLAEKEVRVAAAADWTSSDIRITKGQRLTITAEGEIDLGNDKKSGPAGIAQTDTRKLMTTRPTGALIAVIGDDNDDFIYIGRSAEITAAHNGILFLSVNEGELKDNTGSYRAKVKVIGAK